LEAASVSAPTKPFQPRAAQRAFERDLEAHRICAFLTRRQFGKTTEAARIAFKKMLRTAGHTVVFGSVKLDLGREIVRKESESIHRALAQLGQSAASQQTRLEMVDAETGKDIGRFKPDDFAELYEASRLEFRLHHSRTIYSRTKVVALTPDAVGETGDLILDEVGRVKKFREVWEAVRPIIASNPDFRCILTTTPPPDDTHYSFELLAPPIDAEFAVNPEGNTYRSELGIFVRRVTAWDAAADGVALYDDDTGAPITPDESRAKDHDKDAWDRNYGVKFVLGGTAAIGLLVLDTAQRRGVGQCEFFPVEADGDASFERGLAWIQSHLGPGPVGLGWDLASTEKATSNPSAFAVVEQQSNEFLARAIFTWKTCEAELQHERAQQIVRAVARRTAGGAARRLCVDATNERLFSGQVRDRLRSLIPVELVVGSEGYVRPGAEPMTMKQRLGGLLVGAAEDNHLTLPPSRYVREDFRLVKRDRGSYVCEPDAQGRHGDTFDATKLGLHALSPGSGLTHALPTRTGTFSSLGTGL
jgi:hypothetical protein